MTVIDSVQWTATISDGRNAINAAGNGDGGRVTLDIPANERHVIADLMALTGKSLIVTIIAEDDARGAVVRDRDLPPSTPGPLPFDEADDDVTLGVDGGEVLS